MDVTMFQNLKIENLINPYLFLIVVCFVQFVKGLLPDNAVEGKIVSVCAVLAGTVIGYCTNVGIVAGFVTGFMAPGGIDFVMQKLSDVRDTMFTAKPSDVAPAEPIVPEIKK